MRIIVFFILVITVNISAQNLDQNLDQNFEHNAADSILTEISDSVHVIDSLKNKSQDDLDAIVYANASDSLSFDVKNKL